MRSVAFFNNKGGVGKTTLLCNLASYLSTRKEKRILLIDADPQCNATQYMFSDKTLSYLYEETSSFTIYNIVQPLARGKGYSKELTERRSHNFSIDVLPGDPRLALTEDLLARDWGSAISGDVRGIRTSLLFSELLTRCQHYDYVFFDVGPSLGSINRAVILASDYFLSPMSIDIFSLKGIENIAEWFSQWIKQWRIGLDNTSEPEEIPIKQFEVVKFLGFVSQQYIAKRDSTGTRRAVSAYDRIMSQVDEVIKSRLSKSIQIKMTGINYDLGAIPNLHSLIPMSQTSRKPVFELRASDGVRGAHFAKVKDAEVVFGSVAERLEENISLEIALERD